MTIIFPIEEYKKLRAYVENIKYEISGLGKVEIKGDEIHVKEIRIFEQTVTPAETKLDAQALGRFYDDLLIAGEDPGDWKLWWHSHADMEAFFSQIDTATIADFDTEMPMDNWMVSLVTNHKGQSECRLDIFSPVRCTIGKIDLDISFEDPELEDAILDEITEKVEIVRNTSVHNRKKKDSRVYYPRSTFWPNLPTSTPTNTQEGKVFTIEDGEIVEDSILSPEEREALRSLKGRTQ